MSDVHGWITQPDRLTDDQLAWCIREVAHSVEALETIAAPYGEGVIDGVTDRLATWRAWLAALEAEQQQRANARNEGDTHAD